MADSPGPIAPLGRSLLIMSNFSPVPFLESDQYRTHPLRYPAPSDPLQWPHHGSLRLATLHIRREGSIAEDLFGTDVAPSADAFLHSLGVLKRCLSLLLFSSPALGTISVSNMFFAILPSHRIHRAARHRPSWCGRSNRSERGEYLGGCVQYWRGSSCRCITPCMS